MYVTYGGKPKAAIAITITIATIRLSEEEPGKSRRRLIKHRCIWQQWLRWPLPHLSRLPPPPETPLPLLLLLLLLAMEARSRAQTCACQECNMAL